MFVKTPSIYLEPYMATLMPLSGANCHIYISQHGRVVMLLEKKCLPNHRCCGLGFYPPCCILFLTCRSPKSQSPHEVLAESPWSSPYRILEGLYVDSLKSPLIMRIISGVLKDSLWTPYKVLGESLGSPWGLHYIRISPHGLLGESLWTP